MGLLQEIIESAADPSISVSDFLRRCKTLSYRLGNESFKIWVDRELGGYPAGIDLPAYRTGFRGIVLAQLSGPFGSGASNVPVPISLIPAGGWEDFEFRDGVGTLEALVEGSKADGASTVHYNIPVELFADIDIYEMHSTVRMWSQLSIHHVQGILDRVRTSAQTFALEIESEDPSAGDVAGAAAKIAGSRITQIFNTSIQASNVSMAQGNSGSVEQTIDVVVGDVESLMSRLEELGVALDDRSELRLALAEDAANGDTSEPGEKTRGWLSRMVWRSVSSAGRIAEASVAALVATSIAHYYGINS